MIAKIEFSSTAPKEEVINLVDYGYDVGTSWNDLTNEQQNEITDSLAEQYGVVAGGESIDFENYQSLYELHYDEEELELIKEAHERDI